MFRPILFLNLGVRDEADLRRRLEITRGVENVTMEECFEEALALLEMVFVQRPSLRQLALEPLQERALLTS